MIPIPNSPFLVITLQDNVIESFLESVQQMSPSQVRIMAQGPQFQINYFPRDTKA